MFPILYNSNETNFIHNGLGLLTGSISAIATEELNGMFELHMEYDNDGFLADIIQEEMVIKAKANDKQDEQLFRIYSITKNDENDNLIIDAQHITYDLANNFVEKLEAKNITKRQVMELIGARTAYSHPFNLTSSNWSTHSSTSLYRTNPLQMIGGMDGSILQIWGGQIERDNFNLIMHDRRGSDDGTLVTYKKNLTGLTAKFDISNLVTRIYPFVFKEATDEEPEKLITVSGKYIDSPYINNYEMPYILPVDFSHEEGIETSQDLLAVAKDWFIETGRDNPKVEMEVQFEHLWETEEYKDVAALELVGMGDTITVKHSKLKIEATAIVNRIEYDAVARKNIAVDVGSVKAKFTDKVNKATDIINKVEQIEQSANEAIRTADGKNTIYYGPDEPTGNLREGDLWFKVVDGIYTETYRYDGIQWQLIVSADVRDIEETANEARNRANDAVEKADLATQNANEAIQEAQTAFDEAQDALGKISTVDLKADNAIQKAADSEEKALQAISDSQTAFNKAQENTTIIDSLALRVEGTEGNYTSLTVLVGGLQTEVGRKVDTTTYNSKMTQLDSLIAQTITEEDADKKYTKESSFIQTVDMLQTTIGKKVDSTTYNSKMTQLDNLIATMITEEDADGKYTFKSTFTQTVNGIEAEVGRKVDTTTYNAKMTLLDNAIATKITESHADGKYTLQTTFQQFADGFQTRVSELEKMDISDTNLVLKSNVPVTSSSYSVKVYNLTEDWIVGEEWSIVIKGSVNAGQNFRIWSNGSATSQATLDDVGNGYHRATFKVVKQAVEGLKTLNVYNYPSGGASKATVEWVKLVRAPKTSLSWSPAPEDVEANFSVIDQRVDSIATRVQTTENSYSSLTQTVSGLQTRVSTAEGNISNLTQTSTALQTRISNAEGKLTTITQTSDAIVARVGTLEKSTGNLVKNPELSGGTDGWNSATGLTTVTNTYVAGGFNGTRVLRAETTGNTIFYSDWFDVDPAKTYEVSMFVLKNARRGRWYLGVHGNDTKGGTSNNLGFYPVAKTNGAVGDINANSYMVNSGDNARSAWTKISGYIFPINTPGEEMMGPGEGNTNNLMMDPKLKRMRIRVLHYENGGELTYMYIANPKVVEVGEGAFSQISILNDAINLRVKEGDVINQINIDTSGVLIGGKKLILDGDTTVTGTFRVANANITSVDAGKMTTGTLDAAQVNIINMNASNITTGTITTGRISTLIMTGINNPIIYFGSSTNPDGWINYFEGGLRFQRDNFTYYRVNSGGSAGNSTVLHQFFGGGEVLLNLGKSGSHVQLSTTLGRITFSGTNQEIQFRNGSDSAYQNIRTQDINANNVEAYLYYGKYSSSTAMLRDHSNGNVSVNALGGDLNLGFTSTGRVISRTTFDTLENDIVTRGITMSGGTITSTNSTLILRTNVATSYIYLQSHAETRVTNYGAQAYKPIRASAFPTASLAKWKQDITPWDVDILDIYRNDITVYQYRLKDEVLNGINRLRQGLVIGEEYKTPTALIDGDGTEQYLMNSWNMKAIQEVIKTVDNHTSELSMLREQNEQLILKVARLEERLNILEVA